MSAVVLHVDPAAPEAEVIAQAVAILHGGGVVAFPTDTLYGLAVDPRRDEAVERLYRVKARDPAMALPLVAGSLEQAFVAGIFSDADARLARAFWPGPLSIVVPASPLISRRLVAVDGTVAIRVPDHAVARALPLEAAVAITATSANLSGVPPAFDAPGVAASLGSLIDAILDAGPAHGGPPSTIVQIRNGTLRLLRAGAIPFDRVLEFGL